LDHNPCRRLFWRCEAGLKVARTDTNINDSFFSPIARLALNGMFPLAAASCLNACNVAPLERDIAMTHTLDAYRTAILSNGERWITYYQAGEIEKMRDLYEEDALVMPNDVPV
jgi:hypothetical protein